MKAKVILMKIAIALQVACFSGISIGETIRLYSKTGAFVSDYDKIMESIISGSHNWTHLQFSKTRFSLEKYLGSGGTTVVVSIGGGKALRLPKTSEEPMDMDDEVFRVDRDRLKDYLNTAEYLKSSFGLPVPGIFLSESRATANYIGDLEYVMVEEISPEFSLSQLLSGSTRKSASADMESLMTELSDLAAKSSSLVRIRDLHSDNIIYDNARGWVLLDFSRDVDSWSASRHEPGEHIFSHIRLPGNWSRTIEKRLSKLRSGN